jgi:hypothetical protein
VLAFLRCLDIVQEDLGILAHDRLPPLASQFFGRNGRAGCLTDLVELGRAWARPAASRMSATQSADGIEWPLPLEGTWSSKSTPIHIPEEGVLKRFPPDLNRRDSQRVKDERIFVH